MGHTGLTKASSLLPSESVSFIERRLTCFAGFDVRVFCIGAGSYNTLYRRCQAFTGSFIAAKHKNYPFLFIK